ncbi:hypothetical protein ACQKPB_20965, partial [Sphingomonas sp. NPDC085925]|uniref:hypothetical protein n=1 Tax=unclassified Sphingomonas TaxID=196159 RepID=UPI003D06FDB0
DAVQPQPWGFLFNPTGPFLNRCLARFYPGVDTKLVTSLDLVPDPFAIIRLCAEQHHSHGRAFELLFDPFFYAARASFCLFELCLVIERLRFATWTNHPGIADLHDPSNVTVIVKAKEYPTRHRFPPRSSSTHIKADARCQQAR